MKKRSLITILIISILLGISLILLNTNDKAPKNIPIQASVAKDNSLICCGIPIGIYLKTNGIMIIDISSFCNIYGENINPCEDKFKPGDIIVKADNVQIESKNQFLNIVSQSNGNPIDIEYYEDDVLKKTTITPIMDISHNYKVGLWIRDDTQGIGTLTYIDKNGNFAALGHGICDNDTAALIDIKSGSLYNACILSIHKGSNGNPGELVGSIDYNKNNVVGSIKDNKSTGIYGKIDNMEELISKYNLKYYEIGNKENVKKGQAYILSNVDGQIKEYSINIYDLHSQNSENKNITFEVNDYDLLNSTGGIIQGMSGSPIIQNDKIIGAVTHVFVNDSACGYGIFIDNMLNN